MLNKYLSYIGKVCNTFAPSAILLGKCTEKTLNIFHFLCHSPLLFTVVYLLYQFFVSPLTRKWKGMETSNL